MRLSLSYRRIPCRLPPLRIRPHTMRQDTHFSTPTGMLLRRSPIPPPPRMPPISRLATDTIHTQSPSDYRFRAISPGRPSSRMLFSFDPFVFSPKGTLPSARFDNALSYSVILLSHLLAASSLTVHRVPFRSVRFLFSGPTVRFRWSSYAHYACRMFGSLLLHIG